MKKLRTPSDYEAEINALKAELERMRSVSTAAFGSGVTVGLRTTSLPVEGLEEMILQVSPQDTISYVNGTMAQLLASKDRKSLLGLSVTAVDKGPIGEGLLSALVQVARNSSAPHVLERTCPALPLERLPTQRGERPATDPVLRFSASTVKGHVQIVIQDVTRLRWLEQTFSRYVSEKVIEQLHAMPSEQRLSMERKELTVLFADMRSFTRMTQEIALEELQEMVNSFLGNMVDCIEQLDGTVDKFVGDEVMAIFGAPIPQDDHALRALVCAVEMQRVHQEWIERRKKDGKAFCPLGIGLATGTVVVGNIGTRQRMEYTALGHTVNMAGRLCGSAAGGEVLTIPETHAAALEALENHKGNYPLPRLSFRPKEKMRFKNVEQAVDVVSVFVK
ncbi:MAG: adenylate/guanylate cyclase domain-containing protein [Myxococcaceae bacterium]